MIDPTSIPDALPLTQVPWLDATLKILGAIGVLLTIFANTLPKLWPATQMIAKFGPDLRGVVPKAAEARGAAKEATAQSVGMTTTDQAADKVWPTADEMQPKKENE